MTVEDVKAEVLGQIEQYILLHTVDGEYVSDLDELTTPEGWE